MQKNNIKEKKCVKYLTNEMSKAQRSVFEIELFLDDELLTIFENYKTIWINYPKSNLSINATSFGQILEKHKKNDISIPPSFSGSLRKLAIISATFIFVLCTGLYLFKTTNKIYTTHQIAKSGQRISLTLPDNSTVILNSESELKYLSNFEKKREIWLTGEAFFKVRHNKNIPFIVHTDGLDVKVLGTEFNINSNSTDKIVSLEKGRVNVLLKESHNEIDLLPSEELVWNTKTKAVTKRNFDITKVSAWKDNILLLDEISLRDALPRINQFYGVTFIIKDIKIANQHIKGAFKDQKIEEFIASLTFISNVTVTQTKKNTFLIAQIHEN